MKTLVVGLLGALLAIMLWIVVPVFVSVLLSTRVSVDTTGGGGIGVVNVGFVVPTAFSTLIAALVGFAVAVVWHLRRNRRFTTA